MSEPIKTLRPVHAQTASRTASDEQDRNLEHPRAWARPKPARQERRSTDRRASERRHNERRSKERRSEERRQDSRLAGDRRSGERRKTERRDNDRRSDQRRSRRPLATAQVTSRSAETPPATLPRKGIIDDYA